MIKRLFSLIKKDADPKPAKGATGTATATRPATVSHKPKTSAKSPEIICGIDPKKMSRDEIRKRLAELFRRHNQAEASLDPELREEARIMLDAIVVCREKYVDEG
ncbi:MAG: hypothetical protein KDN19_00345 [Verrucomicrobiae bacterium]|nr:hypothetical protein [Verrucomicrobiae bacterium]